MASVIELLVKVFTLTSNVERLSNNIDKMNDVIRDQGERLTRLESREEVLIEKARSAAANSAMAAVVSLSSKAPTTDLAVPRRDEGSSDAE